jgi:hypothetical protein
MVATTSTATVPETSGPGRADWSDRGTGVAGGGTGGASATTYNKPAVVMRSVTF